MEPIDAEEWDALISACGGANAFHSTEWARALEEAFPQYRMERWSAMRDGERAGLWASFSFAPAPFLSFSEALPWSLPGGLLPLQPLSDADVEKALNAWEKAARSRGRCGLTLACSLEESVLKRAGFSLKERKTTHRLRLPADAETLWNNYKGNARTDIRKARKSGVTTREASSEADAAAFYAIYAETMRRFGSPAKPFRLVRRLALSPIGRLTLAEREGRVAAGLLLLCYAQEASVWMAAGTLESRPFAANRLLYDDALRWAVKRGCKRVDFGASPPDQPGVAAFKASFGASAFEFGVWEKALSPVRFRLWRTAEPWARRAYRRFSSIRKKASNADKSSLYAEKAPLPDRHFRVNGAPKPPAFTPGAVPNEAPEWEELRFMAP